MEGGLGGADKEVVAERDHSDLTRERYVVLKSFTEFNCSFQISEYCHGGHLAGGRGELTGGREDSIEIDQAELTGERGRPMFMERGEQVFNLCLFLS